MYFYFISDVLLCHDDQTGTRKIAFIYYLTRKWHESDGGTLDMFDRDG
jgi:Rps23 Pro-64 3,4-dihydroxylase Tpa1-like proline 4-hydroxylase